MPKVWNGLDDPQRAARIEGYKNLIVSIDKNALLYGLTIVGQLINDINANNGWNLTKRKDWRNKYKVPGILCLIHSEVSEALEAFRKNDRANFEEECADIFIRLLDMTHAMGVDLPNAVLAKLRKNADRGYRHGGKKV